MSNVTSPKSAYAEKPDEGLRQDDPIEVDPPMNVDTPSDGSEEGEIKDDPIEIDPPMNVDIARNGSGDGKSQDDLPMGTKRSRSPSSEREPYPKRAKFNPDREGISFKQIKHPNNTTPCVISANKGTPIGTLYHARNGFAIMMFIDAGRFWSPLISLCFRNNGTRTTKDHARLNWDTVSNDRGVWAMRYIEYGHARTNASDPRMSRPDVLNLCRIKDEGELIYMRFISWGQARGYNEKGRFDNESQDVQTSLKTMFFPRQPYELELWFIAPFLASSFRQNCLRYFTDSEKQRVHPFHYWKDMYGDYYNTTLARTPPPILSDDGKGKTFLRMSELPIRDQSPTSSVEERQHSDAV